MRFLAGDSSSTVLCTRSCTERRGKDTREGGGGGGGGGELNDAKGFFFGKGEGGKRLDSHTLGKT